MRTQPCLSLALKSVLLGSVAFAPAAFAQDSRTLDEITVTAERREASLQDVPLAVSAFDGAVLERRQVGQVEQIFTEVPGLVGSNNVGQSTATTFFLRGIGTTESIVTVDPAVGVYVDDVYIARQGVNNFGLYDLERVEVLRGPQGTLYGRNSSAGAVKVISKDPSYDFEARGSITYGNYNRLDARMSINVPVIDDVMAVRLNALTETRDGYSQNVEFDDEVNDKNFIGFRVRTLIEPADNWRFIIAADYMEDDADSVYASDRSDFDVALGGAPVPVPAADLFNSRTDVEQENLSRTWGYSLTAEWDIMPELQVSSITAYRATTQEYILDLSDQAPSVYTLLTDNDSRQTSQELRATGVFDDLGLTYVAGLFYFDENSTSFLGNSFPVLGGIYNVQTIETGSESIALFGEVIYSVTDKIDVFAGIRWTDEEKDLNTEFFAFLPEVGFSTFGAAPAFTMDDVTALGTPASLSFSEVTPRAGINYAVTDDILTYFQFSRGFKSGGWLARLTFPNPNEVQNFEPEIVDLYEIGLKAELFDNTIRTNIAVFYQDFANLFNTATTDTGFTGFTADASIYGVEFEGTWRVNEWLDLFGNFAIMEGEYKNLTEQGAASLGEELQRLPTLQGKVGFSVARNLPQNLGLFRLNAAYTYMGDHFVSTANQPFTETQYELVDASIGWERSDGAFGVSLNCTNCLDEGYFHSMLPFFGIQPAYPGDPAFYSISFEAAF